jgi:hypothetical protein
LKIQLLSLGDTIGICREILLIRFRFSFSKIIGFNPNCSVNALSRGFVGRLSLKRSKKVFLFIRNFLFYILVASCACASIAETEANKAILPSNFVFIGLGF